jgi:hypothetical protein
MNDIVESFGPAADAPVSSSALAMQSREVAEIQTKYLMAQRFPRDERKAMDGIVNAFSRAGLAERAAYEYAKGGSAVSGPSIHAAQAIAQQWGNIEFGFREVSRGTGPDGVPFSEVEAFATDMQSRVPSSITFIVRHWRDTRSGGYRLKDEREVYELTANMAQRRKRACILSVLPQDVIDAAMQQADVTLKTKADTSPEAMARMVEAFGPFGVTKDQLEKRIQRRLDAITPAQVVMLKRIYASLRDEMSTPAEWFEVAADAAPTPASVEEVRAAVQAKRTTKPPAPPAPSAQFFIDAIGKASSEETAGLVLDEARSTLTEAEGVTVLAAYRQKYPNAKD